jgi:hypothetical protein
MDLVSIKLFSSLVFQSIIEYRGFSSLLISMEVETQLSQEHLFFEQDKIEVIV